MGSAAVPVALAQRLAGQPETVQTPLAGGPKAGPETVRRDAEQRARDARAPHSRPRGCVSTGDGTFAFTKRNARQFSARGRKDLAYALMYARVAFLVWLKSGEDASQFEGEGAVTIKGW
jgi:hypothetical protein